jgi:succinyl-CoA synthetase beta subunit
MDLMEYKAKELFNKYGIPVPEGVLIEDAGEVAEKISEMTFPVVLKSQVQTGGRGKAGGIKFARDLHEAVKVAENVMGMNIHGHIVKKLLAEQKIGISKELYLSIMLDRLTKSPMIIFSPVGGVDIEDIAKNNPEKIVKYKLDPLIGIKDYIVRYIINKSGIHYDIFNQLYDIIVKLYKLFCEYDCLLVEINPLVITQDNRMIAIDAKISVDDSALIRRPDIAVFRDSLVEDVLIVQARKYRFLYIPCEPDGNIAVISNGSGMIMSCMDLISKEGMKVGAALDLGGGATSDRIAQAIRIVSSNKNIKALFISIFGGITRCDEVAAGVKIGMERNGNSEKLIAIRIEGTNRKKGMEILKNIKGNIISVDSIKEGVRELASRREQL